MLPAAEGSSASVGFFDGEDYTLLPCDEDLFDWVEKPNGLFVAVTDYTIGDLDDRYSALKTSSEERSLFVPFISDLIRNVDQEPLEALETTLKDYERWSGTKGRLSPEEQRGLMGVTIRT